MSTTELRTPFAPGALQPGKLVSLRGRDWIVLPSDDRDLLVVKPLGGSEDEITGIYLPLAIPADQPHDAHFLPPGPDDLGDITTARLLYDAARLAFRNGAGPFRCLARLSFRPRSYQLVPLIMALRQQTTRLLIADDVGVGKTVEALLIVRELLERRTIKRFAVVCLPHLCDQWQAEIRAKLDLEAVIIRSNTQAQLDRQIHGDASVFEYYPYQVLSIDFIKAENRRDVFVQQCPELVVVDEAHTCARPAGASVGQQQRYYLVNRIAAKADQHLVLLTATPHSGKPEEFQSLLGLLRPEFAAIDLPDSSQQQRRELARYFVQRKRADVARWLGEETPFPEREAFEWPYELSPGYRALFQEILSFARRLVAPAAGEEAQRRRIRYWTALGLLRGVISSPAAGIEMLNARAAGEAGYSPDGADAGAESADANMAAGQPAAWADDDAENPIYDSPDGFELDASPTQVVDAVDWSQYQRQQLRAFARQLAALTGPDDDLKLANAELILEEWLKEGLQPVVFCRYIATANYVGLHLGGRLAARFPKLDVQVITSELPDEVRKGRIDEMGKGPLRLLVATDCLSEGINLQEHFTAVLHYDLPWNPNRLEQREGRVDRFGQTAPVVKACLLYGEDNAIDGVVLKVLLRKVREIKRAIGINVPFPEDSQSIIDAIAQSLLISPERARPARSAGQGAGAQEDGQLALFGDLDGALAGGLIESLPGREAITRRVEEAAEREKVSRSIFAQNAIKAQEIEADLAEMDEAIGDPRAVESFVTAGLTILFGVQITPDRQGHRLVTGNLPPQLAGLLPPGESVRVSFRSPTPPGYTYLGRNHRFVEGLCQLVMAHALSPVSGGGGRPRAARAAVIRTDQVTAKTTLLLFRCRNVIEQGRGGRQIVAEEMLAWGWRGAPGQMAPQMEPLAHAEAKALLLAARATSNLSPQSRAAFLTNELKLLAGMGAEQDAVAEQQAQRLVAAHERFRRLLDHQRYQVAYPVLPMDMLGVYILLPDGASNGGSGV